MSITPVNPPETWYRAVCDRCGADLGIWPTRTRATRHVVDHTCEGGTDREQD